jgi:hypothetical protein
MSSPDGRPPKKRTRTGVASSIALTRLESFVLGNRSWVSLGGADRRHVLRSLTAPVRVRGY